MIAFVRGEVDRTGENSVIVDTGGVGYLVYISARTLGKLSGEKNVKLYTYHQAKEDGTALYGFLSFEELSMFNRLITVTGFGPKSAMSLLGSLDPKEIALAIISDDADSLTKAPGVGKKTAQRIILDLKDKIKNDDSFAGQALQSQQSFSGNESSSDAILALTALGYNRSDAVKAVVSVSEPGMTAELIIKAALKKLI